MLTPVYNNLFILGLPYQRQTNLSIDTVWFYCKRNQTVGHFIYQSINPKSWTHNHYNFSLLNDNDNANGSLLIGKTNPYLQSDCLITGIRRYCQRYLQICIARSAYRISQLLPLRIDFYSQQVGNSRPHNQHFLSKLCLSLIKKPFQLYLFKVYLARHVSSYSKNVIWFFEYYTYLSHTIKVFNHKALIRVTNLPKICFMSLGIQFCKFQYRMKRVMKIILFLCFF